MSCHDINNTPCGCGDPCNQGIGNCYDDCGCLNPTSFSCIENLEVALPNIGAEKSMNGLEVMSAIDYALGVIKNDLASFSAPVGNISDIRAKISATDTTTGYLEAKIIAGAHMKPVVLNRGNNEQLRLNVTPETLISKDGGNLLTKGQDGLLRVFFKQDGAATKIRNGQGIEVTGSGTNEDPYVLTAKGFLQAKRNCFDGVWREFILGETGISGVRYTSGKPQYRIRHDGTIEFKGNAVYTVNFGNYDSVDRKFVISAGSLGVSCITAAEQNNLTDLKSITYIDVPQPSADQITQQYSYIIRKKNQDILLEFQSSFSENTTKTVVVSFDGAIYHPNLSNV